MKSSSAVQRTTAKPSAVRNKYDPRIGTLFTMGMRPDNVHYPCPECGRIEFNIKYSDEQKITTCKCGYETIGDFQKVTV